VQTRAPAPRRYEKLTRAASESGDYNIAAVRAAFRVFVTAYVGLKGWEAITQKLARRRGNTPGPATKVAARHPNARVALSYATIMLFYRLLHRFFNRLRASLLEDSAAPFRKRNPRVTRLLTGAYTPAIGAALSGLFLGLSPADQLRLTASLYLLARGLEFGYNALEDSGRLWGHKKAQRPWWFGSWLFMPLACGQLLHAFVFDRDCFPASYGRFILARSPEYIQLRSPNYPATTSKPWPGTFDIVDALAALSNLRWPAFTSPILFPNLPIPSHPALAKVIPITSPAHPAILHTSCALLHPSDPSCARTHLKYWLTAFPQTTKFFTLVYGAFALLAYKRLFASPLPFLNALAARILRLALFVTGAIGTSWGSICLFSALLPRSALVTQRWFLGGFLGGLWAFVARRGERGTFLYSARLSGESLWKVGRKRGWWKGVKGGDVWVFVVGLALVGGVYEAQPEAVRGAFVRKGLGVLRGEGWVDRAVKGKEEGGDERRGEVGEIQELKGKKEE